ncbi:MAG: hypothetical protein P9M14_17270 [Candidatus Alcyoniella australis]|nr:hypothetical protein [Candidatus Alcyoniella australis]
MRRMIAILLVLILAALLAACPEEEQDQGREEAGEYVYRAALSAGQWAVIVDPYDSSLELFDPANTVHRSLAAAQELADIKTVANGETLAVLDGAADQILVVNPANQSVVRTIDVGESANRLIVSPDGVHVLALYDPNAGEADYGEGGVINYYEMNVVDAQAGSAVALSIDFTPDNIAFAPAGDRCLLSKDYRVVYLDLDTLETSTFPLSLGPEDPREPSMMSISPDGELALVLADKLPDLYVLDLLAPSINIIDIERSASDIVFIPETRIALLTIPELSRLSVLDLDQGMLENIDLTISAERVLLSDDGSLAVLYDRGEDMLLTVDLADFDVQSYPLSVNVSSSVDDPVKFIGEGRLLVIGKSGSGEFGSNDINLVDLERNVAVPIGFQGEFESYALGNSTMAVVMAQERRLVRLDLDTLQAQSWDLGTYPQNVTYVAGAQAFCVDYLDEEGKVTFVGDQGTEIYWSDRDFFNRWK